MNGDHGFAETLGFVRVLREPVEDRHLEHHVERRLASLDGCRKRLPGLPTPLPAHGQDAATDRAGYVASERLAKRREREPTIVTECQDAEVRERPHEPAERIGIAPRGSGQFAGGLGATCKMVGDAEAGGGVDETGEDEPRSHLCQSRLRRRLRWCGLFGHAEAPR